MQLTHFVLDDFLCFSVNGAAFLFTVDCQINLTCKAMTAFYKIY
nr:MAG TPA: hypothetical protein [Caudoviricetes sp.]